MSNENKLIGCRVVRGPNFRWRTKERTDGLVGIISYELQINSNLYKFGVIWENGIEEEYDFEDQKDLLIVDNAQAGVCHKYIICDACAVGRIPGIRFKCAQCPDYDLCSFCYGDNVHDLDHSFIRYTLPKPTCLILPPRSKSKRKRLLGIYKDAKVVERLTFDGIVGTVTNVLSNNSYHHLRDSVIVKWPNGSEVVYNRGSDGLLDLKYEIYSCGGHYYEDHMPILAEYKQNTTLVPSSFSIADQVRVCLDENSLKQLQEGHGGWKPSYSPQVIGQLGNVIAILPNGDISVEFDTLCVRLNPAVLAKVISFRTGERVKILKIGNFFGQVGKISKISYCGGLILQLDNNKINQHPKWVTKIDAQCDGAVGALENNIKRLSIKINSNECIVCNKKLELVQFRPCKHRLACEDCSKRMIKCMHCGVLIDRRSAANDRLGETDESNLCVICLERVRNIVFQCGHSACSECAVKIERCHSCRAAIQQRIKVY